MRSPAPPFAFRALCALAAATSMLMTSCKSPERKEQEQACMAAVHAGRLDVKDGRLDEARQKLATAESACPELRQPYVAQLRDQIASRQAKAEEERQREAAEGERRREHPVFPFMEWVKLEASATDKQASTGARCREPGQPDQGWCDATREVVAGAPFHLRFRQHEPEAFRFTAELGAPAVCDDLDAHRVVRSWEVSGGPGPALRRTHCELLSKSYRGLAALVTTTGAKTTVDVFSRGYLDQDQAFADMLRSQGR